MKEKINIPLASFQKWMQQLLLDPFQQTSLDPYKLLPSHAHSSSLNDIVHDSKKMHAQEHLGIYQRSYIARLRHCMSQQFSALEYALGTEIFRAFADDYLASTPSYHYNLSLLGKHFAEYLEKNRPDANTKDKEEWIDFIIELAKFEYTIGVIFDQKAEENYRLAETNTPEECINLVPICALFHFRFPVRHYFSEFKNENHPDLPYEEESYCVVTRHEFKLAAYDLHKEQYDFLRLMKKGKNLSEAKAMFIEDHKIDTRKFDLVWSRWKARWLDTKLLRS